MRISISLEAYTPYLEHGDKRVNLTEAQLKQADDESKTIRGDVTYTDGSKARDAKRRKTLEGFTYTHADGESIKKEIVAGFMAMEYFAPAEP